MSLACIVFDCDGVILDSVPTKTRAFARLAEPYGAEARDRFVMYHMTHGGVSRYRKFAWFSLRSWDGKSRLRSPRNGESVLLPILWRK